MRYCILLSALLALNGKEVLGPLITKKDPEVAPKLNLKFTFFNFGFNFIAAVNLFFGTHLCQGPL